MHKPDPPLIRHIWQCAGFYGLRNMTALSRATGLPYWIVQDRIHHPEHFTLEELMVLREKIDIDPAIVGEAIGGARK